MLNTLELLNLEEKLLVEFNENMTGILSLLNRKDQLFEFLEMIGLAGLISSQPIYSPYKTGKIVVVGGSEVKESVFAAVAKGLGISKERFEFCLDYESAQKYNYKKMQYNPNYSLVIFGPIGHSGYEKGNYGSVISALENKEGYPPILKSGKNELKLTKSGFKECLLNAIEKGYIS